ncbi:MAG: hypothetical protein V7L05_02425 [Nostoc sp.]|uniref:hypothetical protein n=1 Tax=Nostoc sp. TaxID=1180 RepID=UPI002FFC453B
MGFLYLTQARTAITQFKMGEPGVINEWLNSVKLTCLTNRKGRNRYSGGAIAVDHRLAIAEATS